MRTPFQRIRFAIACLLILTVASLTVAGCATKSQTGALAGAGMGALIGQVIGRNTVGTLIGAGVGAGIGYLIGNERDKQDALDRQAKGLPPETGPLGGTKWKAVKVNPAPANPYKKYVFEFTKDGRLNTTKTFSDGSQEIDQERYRVVGNKLIINDPGYIINAKYSLKGKRLTITSDKFTAVLTRIG